MGEEAGGCAATTVSDDAVAGGVGAARLLAILTGAALAALVAAWAADVADSPRALTLVLYVLSYATGGYSGVVNGWAALRRRELNVDILMLLAAAGAASIGAWLEGGILLFLFSLSEALQAYALGRTEGAIHALMDLRPDVGRLREGDRTRMVPVEDLRPGDVVVVLSGERIPVDGKIEAGESDVDQAAITGESVPVAKGPGDDVFAATLNGAGVLDVRMERPAEESTVARIITMVHEARASRAPTQRFIDRFGNRYAWAVIAGAAMMMALPTLLLEWPFEESFYRAMTLLVVASPCALVISTPASYLSAIAAAARNGVLFKGGAFLEAAASIDTVALDKTGTLTLGRPRLTDVVPLHGGSADDLLALAASVEASSEHLIARAIVAGAEARGLELSRASDVQAFHGLGIGAQVDGRLVTIGRALLFEEDGTLDDGAREAAEKLEEQGKTAMVVAVDGRPVGALAVADAVRPEAAMTVAALREIGVRRVTMMTGDNEHVARAVAAEVGVHEDDVHAELMPADKVALVRQLGATNHVAFVGDGVNDAPALAVASLGVAMGVGGSDVALETADVVLMGDHLERLVYVFALGRAARRIVQQNVAFSLAVIVILVATNLWRGMPLPLGVIAHEGSTVIVVLNGLRLLRYQPRILRASRTANSRVGLGHGAPRPKVSG